MIQLSNGAKVLQAYIMPEEPGMKPHGICLAQINDDRYAVWNIHWDEELVEVARDEQGDSILHEVWEADSGEYFTRGSSPDLRGLAEYAFGRRLYRHVCHNSMRGFGSAMSAVYVGGS